MKDSNDSSEGKENTGLEAQMNIDVASIGIIG